MFESLADRIREDEQKQSNRAQRMMLWAAVAVLTVVLFGGLYLGIKFLQ